MKLAVFFLAAFLFSQNLLAGIGGSGGGVSAAVDDVNSPTGYVTQICEATEQGKITSCRTVYFKPKHGKAPKVQPKLPCNERDDRGCDYQAHSKVNELSGKIDKWFADQGYEQPTEDSKSNNQPWFNDHHNN